MNRVWLRSLIALSIVLAAALLAWAIRGPTWGWALLAGGLALLLGHLLRNLAQLDHWLRQSSDTQVPAGSGVWQYVFSALNRFAKERARQSRALILALERFRKAGQAIPDGVVMLDVRNRIEWSNAAAQTHIGLDERRDVGQPILNLIRQPEFVEYLNAGDYSLPLTLASDRGNALVLSLQLVPYGDSQKLLISRDVTELERVTTVRRDFVANVSHELKTPLTVISGFLETIQDTNPGQRERERYLDLMSTQTRNMQRLVEDLLVLSALESQDHVTREEKLQVSKLLESLYTEAHTLSEGKHRIELNVTDDRILLGSETELRSAFSNLVSNAIRYTAPGGEIKLEWRLDGGEGLFCVQDTGIGIESEHIPRLTERFYRVDRSRSRATGGTGLGLAIVKHVLMRHQATLEVTSEPGKGSCFAARFPERRILPAPAAVTEPPRAEALRA